MENPLAERQTADVMQVVKPIGAGILLLLGVLCLGRAIETSLDPNPNRLAKRETITAGVLLGLPATVGGTWLVLASQRQRQREAEKHLKETFFKLVKAGRGKVTALRFSMEAQIDGETAKAYLSDRSREYDATFQVDNEGGITYCFHLDNLDSRLLDPSPHRREQQIAEEKQLREIFFRLVKAGRGKVTALRFSMEAHIDGERAKAYLSDRCQEFDATTQVDNEGGITYCFHLGDVDSRLLQPTRQITFDVVLEAVPPVKQREVVKTVQQLTGLDWKAVKALIRDVPQPIQRGASPATAEEFKQALAKVGAEVTVILSDQS
ncbi:MAG: ribosomal protein L7/L12 [Cyanobacteria bacterium P01_F01_bin.86]